ncbi:MAG: FG-GAP-like repeat-containing protein [bacterium]|nr:FG-GAP-like repeat-containing protein [bacterium]
MIGNGSGYNFKVYKNDGSGTFSEIQNLSPGLQDGNIAIGDFNNDGDLDLAVSGYDGTSRYLNIYTNNGHGSYALCENLNPGLRYSDLVAGDIDRDGDLDLIAAGFDGSDHRFLIYTNCSGKFTVKKSFSPETASSMPCSLILGDFNNNGGLDLAKAGGDTSASEFLSFSNNNGNFYTNQMIASSWPSFGCLAAGDINNDGKRDLILGGFEPAAMYPFRVYTNYGPGRFTNYQDLNQALQFTPESITLGDIDSDNDLDLIAVGFQSGTGNLIKVFRNLADALNNLPSQPDNLVVKKTNNNWRFEWSPASDDHTPQNLLRYHIAIGTNQTGVYNYISTAIDYPRGQANIGNVPDGWISPSLCYYQSKIPVIKKAFWRVCAIDSAFKNSGYSTEQNTLPPTPAIIKCQALSQTSIFLRWTNQQNITSYTLYRHTRNDFWESSRIAGCSAGITSYTDKSLASGTTYYYWIKSYNTCGESPFSLPSAFASTVLFSSSITIPDEQGFLERNGSIKGTSSSIIVDVSSVQIRLKDPSHDLCWNGSGWGASTNSWLDASGTASWEYNTRPVAWTYGNKYTVECRARGINDEVELNHDKREFITVYETDEKYSFCNYPNPFSPLKEETTIEYFLNSISDIKLVVFDVNGGVVKEWSFSGGCAGAKHGVNRISWNGKNDKGYVIANGVYFCYLKTKSGKYMNRIMVLK